MTKLFFSRRRTQPKSIQRKKHYTQMTNDELNLCLELLRDNFNNFTFSEHSKKKAHCYLNCNEVIYSMKKDNFIKNIIEYNVTKTKSGQKEQRLLIRHPKIVRIGRNKCYQYFVYSITTKRIITIYYNLVSDKRETFDISYYCEDLQITRNFKG